MDDNALREELTRLRRELRQNQQFLDGLPDALVDIDLKTTRVVAINVMTTIVMGFTNEDVESGLDARVMASPEENQRMSDISTAFIRAGLGAGGGRYKRSGTYNAFEVRLLRRDGTEFDAEVQASYVLDEAERPTIMRSIIRDISVRKAEERLRQETIAQLHEALARVKRLSGLIPICAWCRRIRDDKGYWQQIETYISEHSDADFTHGICESCSSGMIADRENGDEA